MTGRTLAITCLAAGAIALGSACGDSDTAPSPPATTTTTISGGGPPTITITSTGVNPKALTVVRGAQVTFTNNDTVPHDMASNPHPIHTDCPEITVGSLSAGQSRTTASLNTPKTCGYHDHNRSGDTSLQGTITIQ